jgi:hypothetical protein
MVSVGTAIPNQNAKRSAQPQARPATRLKWDTPLVGYSESKQDAVPIINIKTKTPGTQSLVPGVLFKTLALNNL